MSSIRDIWTSKIHDLQNKICAAVEEEDGGALFHEDVWERRESLGNLLVCSNHVTKRRDRQEESQECPRQWSPMQASEGNCSNDSK